MTSPPPQRDAAASAGVSTFRRVGALLLALGVVLLVAAATAGVARGLWIARARHADGTVTDIQRQLSSSGGGRTTLYRPVVAFTADDGRAVAVRGSVWSSYTPYRLGDRVRVDYAPGRPGGAVLDDGLQRWFLTGFLLLFGVIITFIGVVFRLVSGNGAASGWTVVTRRGPGG